MNQNPTQAQKNLQEQAREAGALTAHHTRGTTLLRRGAPAAGIHFLLNGPVRLFINSLEGEVELGYATEGTALGLSSVISGEGAEVNAIVQGPAETLFIPREQFLNLLQSRPWLYGDVAVALSCSAMKALRDLREVRRSTTRRSYAHAQ